MIAPLEWHQKLLSGLHVQIYTPAHLKAFSYTEREKWEGGGRNGGGEKERKERKRGSVLKSSASLIAQDLHFLIGVSSDVG